MRDKSETYLGEWLTKLREQFVREQFVMKMSFKHNRALLSEEFRSLNTLGEIDSWQSESALYFF